VTAVSFNKTIRVGRLPKAAHPDRFWYISHRIILLPGSLSSAATLPFLPQYINNQLLHEIQADIGGAGTFIHRALGLFHRLFLPIRLIKFSLRYLFYTFVSAKA